MSMFDRDGLVILRVKTNAVDALGVEDLSRGS